MHMYIYYTHIIFVLYIRILCLFHALCVCVCVCVCVYTYIYNTYTYAYASYTCVMWMLHVYIMIYIRSRGPFSVESFSKCGEWRSWAHSSMIYTRSRGSLMMYTCSRGAFSGECGEWRSWAHSSRQHARLLRHPGKKAVNSCHMCYVYDVYARTYVDVAHYTLTLVITYMTYMHIR